MAARFSAGRSLDLMRICDHFVRVLDAAAGILVTTLKRGEYCEWLLEASITSL